MSFSNQKNDRNYAVRKREMKYGIAKFSRIKENGNTTDRMTQITNSFKSRKSSKMKYVGIN
jgi:hypothetical protein